MNDAENLAQAVEVFLDEVAKETDAQLKGIYNWGMHSPEYFDAQNNMRRAITGYRKRYPKR